MATSCSLSTDNFNQVSLACGPNISPHWQQLAKHLDIHLSIVTSISISKSGQTTQCFDELLSVWLRQTGSSNQPPPTWRLLCDAIANIDKPLSKKMWADHIKECSVCRKGEKRCTPVAVAATQKDPKTAATELKKLFNDLICFMIKEIRRVDVDKLRCKIRKHLQDERGKVDEKIEQYLVQVDCDYDTPKAILNYLIDVKFIGYINYSLIAVFQEVANSPLLDVRINEYVKDYHSFLGLTFMEYADAFQLPDLRPEYPAGIPTFSFYLESEWNGKEMLTLEEVLKRCCTNSDWIRQLTITRIKRHCIIITFAVLPRIAREVLKYLTNDDVIESLKKEGISVDISEQLMKYKEDELKTLKEHQLQLSKSSREVYKVTLHETPTPQTVFRLLERYSAQWNELGRELGISMNYREMLYNERTISAEARLEAVINQWIESMCSPVSWDNLIHALRIMGLQEVVDVITENLPAGPAPQDMDILYILSSIPVTSKLRTFSLYLGLPSDQCSEIFDDPTIKGDFDVQRHRVLQLWKTRTWEDFIVALDRTGYHQKARELTAQYKIKLV